MALEFDEVRFPETVSWGVVGGPNFSTTVLASALGYESRNRNWAQPRCEFDCAQNIHTQEELDVLLAFFYARMGPARGFRFKDWMDYKHDMRLTGAARQSLYPAVGTGSLLVFQLVKTYADSAGSQRRVITKPVQDTIKIYVNNVLRTETTHYTIDYATGVVTFTGGNAPPNGQAVQWEGEFDIPVRFEGDDMPVRIDDFRHTNWGGIKVVEIRDPEVYVPQAAVASAFHDVRLPELKDFGVTGGPRFRTNVFKSTGGHEARESRWTLSRSSYIAGHLLQTHDEFYVLLNFFRARYGRAFGFRFKDWTDYKANMTGDDPVTMAVSESGVLEYQITKPYIDLGNEQPREITRPVQGTVQIWVNGVLLTEDLTPPPAAGQYSIDYATGIVTFGTQPTGLIEWLGEFDVPVRFDVDLMTVAYPSYGRFNWTGIKLVELREAA